MALYVGEINQIVQVSLSWQLEHWGEEQGTLSSNTVLIPPTYPLDKRNSLVFVLTLGVTGHLPNSGATMKRFPPEQIKALARQMSVSPVLLEGNQSSQHPSIFTKKLKYRINTI